jgi:2-polyprenyl-6-methoxyphenol hydroxylase-like FAD-dependent oxidoreductase
MQNEPALPTFEVISVQQTICSIVGSGPAGAVLALLLARQGIPVILLEEHLDFDRDVRGDTIHPSVMQILDEIGLADRVLELRHSKVYGISIKTAQESVTLADLRRLKTRFPYVLMIPQAHFLEFITDEAKRYPNYPRDAQRAEESWSTLWLTSGPLDTLKGPATSHGFSGSGTLPADQ